MATSKLEEATKPAYPVLPKFLVMPLKIIPDSLHSSALVAMLNQILKSDLLAGDLDFIQGRYVSIKVHDAAITCQLTLFDKKLKIYGGEKKCDLSIKANLYDFLMLVSREEDADTLVFQRRLVMEGDTELGLFLKNYIDGMDIESYKFLPVIELMARRTLPVYKKLFG